MTDTLLQLPGQLCSAAKSKKVGKFAFFDPLEATFSGFSYCFLVLFAHFLGKVVEDLGLLLLLVDQYATEKFHILQFFEDFEQYIACTVEDEKLCRLFRMEMLTSGFGRLGVFDVFWQALFVEELGQ